MQVEFRWTGASGKAKAATVPCDGLGDAINAARAFHAQLRRATILPPPVIEIWSAGPGEERRLLERVEPDQGGDS